MFFIIFLFLSFLLPFSKGLDEFIQPIWDDINIIAVTDVHSWISGHPHEANYQADYGDFHSLIEHLKAKAEENKQDLFLFNSGDMIDGTGISAVTPISGEYVFPIIQRIPFDALTTGNHELYETNVVEHMRDNVIPIWGNRYITSDVSWLDNSTFGGSRSYVIEGKFGARILVFGFHYVMNNHCDVIKISPIEQVIQESWFLDALSSPAIDNIHSIVVLAHLDYHLEEFELLINTIRNNVSDGMPIVLISGHIHQTTAEKWDNHTLLLLPGCYFRQLGWTSYHTKTYGEIDFHTSFINTHPAIFAAWVGLDYWTDLPTENGNETKEMILSIREHFGLDRVLGCSAKTYKRDLPIEDEKSVFYLIQNYILVQQLIALNELAEIPQTLALMGTSGLRYNIFLGEVTIDDCITVSPFPNEYYIIKDIGFLDLSSLFQILQTRNITDDSIDPPIMTQSLNKINSAHKIIYSATNSWMVPPTAGLPFQNRNNLLFMTTDIKNPPNYILSPGLPEPDGFQNYHLIVNSFDLPTIMDILVDMNTKYIDDFILFAPGVNQTSIFIDFIRDYWGMDECDKIFPSFDLFGFDNLKIAGICMLLLIIGGGIFWGLCYYNYKKDSYLKVERFKQKQSHSRLVHNEGQSPRKRTKIKKMQQEKFPDIIDEI